LLRTGADENYIVDAEGGFLLLLFAADDFKAVVVRRVLDVTAANQFGFSRGGQRRRRGDGRAGLLLARGIGVGLRFYRSKREAESEK
jgi:hypothetical protein